MPLKKEEEERPRINSPDTLYQLGVRKNHSTIEQFHRVAKKIKMDLEEKGL